MISKNSLKTKAFRRAKVFSATSLIALSTALANAQTPEIYNFDLKVQSLAEALIQFSEKTNVVITVRSDLLAGKVSPAIKGEMSAKGALSYLLQETAFNVIEQQDGTIIIRMPNSDKTSFMENTSLSADAEDIAYYESNLAVEEDNSMAAGDFDNEAPLDEIVITGSRLARSGVDTPVPVTQLSSNEIQLSGATNIVDIVRDLPALGVGQGSASTNGPSQGLNLLDLRRLGTQRTLVLVDGRRHVGSQAGDTAVDITTIPTALVERVEVLTGGASAVYGADAVTGVVNFIMKDDFEGIEANAHIGLTEHGGGFEQKYSITAGGNFDESKGNITFHVEYNKRESIMATQRDYLNKDRSLINNPGEGPLFVESDNRVFTFPTPGGQIRVALNGAAPTCATPPGGPFNANFDWFTIDESTNQLRCFNFGDTTATPVIRTGDNIDGLAVTPYVQLHSPLERFLIHSTFKYDVADNVTLYGNAKFSNSEASARGVPVYDVPNPTLSDPININIRNPFIPDDLRAIMEDRGVDSVRITKAGTDLGVQRSTSERNLFQITLGAEGQLGDSVNWDMYYQHGESRTSSVSVNRLSSRDAMSLDAVLDFEGNIVCAASLDPSDPNFSDVGSALDKNECAPRNPFGVANSSQEAIDFLMKEFTDTAKLKQDVAGLTINTSLFDMPAGEILIATGLEYRAESSQFVPDTALQLGLADYGNATSGVSGSYNVKEIFGEILIPLLSDVTLVKALNLEAAVRYSDYSTSGGTTAYKVAGDWAINDSLRFRASYSSAVRAPNIGELFAPQISGVALVIDPCSTTKINNQTDPTKLANRIKNCALLVPDNFLSFADLTSMPTLRSGNPDLTPETGKTLTLGAILTPTFLPGFIFTIDYYDMTFENAISTSSLNDSLANCVESEDLNNPFCALIKRFPKDFADPSLQGQIDLLLNKNINTAELRTKGVDFEANYRFDMEDLISSAKGDMHVRLIGSYTINQDTLAVADRPDELSANAGEIGASKWLVNFLATYALEDLSVQWRSRYIGGAVIDNDFTSDDIANNNIPSRLYHYLSARYELSNMVTLSAGINNVFDTIPPQRATSFTSVGSAFTGASGVYDTRGRSFYFSTKIKF